MKKFSNQDWPPLFHELIARGYEVVTKSDEHPAIATLQNGRLQVCVGVENGLWTVSARPMPLATEAPGQENLFWQPELWEYWLGRTPSLRTVDRQTQQQIMLSNEAAIRSTLGQEPATQIQSWMKRENLRALKEAHPVGPWDKF